MLVLTLSNQSLLYESFSERHLVTYQYTIVIGLGLTIENLPLSAKCEAALKSCKLTDTMTNNGV